MENKSSTNPFANGASEDITCEKGALLLDLSSGNDANSFQHNGKKTPDLYFLERPSNGKVTDDEDLGPETDVDAVDDIQLSPCNNNPFNTDPELQPQKLDFESIKEPRRETPTPPADEVTGVAGLVPDNVAESGEESEDEWNYYRVEPGGNTKETESQQTIPPVCEKPASLPGVAVPLESAENMESQLNPNAAEFIPSPTQQRSVEQFLLSETAEGGTAVLSSQKTEESTSKVLFANDTSSSLSESENLPDLLNGQQNEHLSSPCEPEIGASDSVSDGVADTFSDKLDEVAALESVSESKISGAVIDRSLEEEKYEVSDHSAATLRDFSCEPLLASPGFLQFSDNRTEDESAVTVKVQALSDASSVSPVPQESTDSTPEDKIVTIGESSELKDLCTDLDNFEKLVRHETELAFDTSIENVDIGEVISSTVQNLVDAENTSIGESDQLKDFCTDFDEVAESRETVATNLELDTSGNTINSQFHASSPVQEVVASKNDVVVEESDITTEVSSETSELMDMQTSFHAEETQKQPFHISFELQKDIAPEMESQPELVRLNGDDSSLSFDTQEALLEETREEIEGIHGTSSETPIELAVNDQVNLEDSLKDLTAEVGLAFASNVPEPITKNEPSFDYQESVLNPEVLPPLDLTISNEELLQNYRESNPLNVCVYPLDNINSINDLVELDPSKELAIDEQCPVTLFQNESENSRETEHSQQESGSDLLVEFGEVVSKIHLESPGVTQTPPSTPALTVTAEDLKPTAEIVPEVEKLPEANKLGDYVETEIVSEVEIVGMAATAAVATVAAAAVAADITERKSADESLSTNKESEIAEVKKEVLVSPKKPATVKSKKPLPDKSKAPSKSPASSRPVPSKTVKSVPTSPTKPLTAAPVPKASPKKLPTTTQTTKAQKGPSSTTTVASLNRPKSNGIASKPSPGLLKSRPPSGISSASSDLGKTSTKRPEPLGNKIGTSSTLTSRTRPVSAPVPPIKSSKPAPNKTTAAPPPRPSTAATNGSITKSKVTSSLSRPKTVAQSKVANVKEGKESVNKQISSSRPTAKPTSASTATRTVTHTTTTRKIESKSVGNSQSVTKTATTTLQSTSKSGTRKMISSVSSSSSKAKMSASAENRDSVKEVTSSVITNNEVKCDQVLFENAGLAE